MKCQASKTFLSARERWWYVVASQCDSVQVWLQWLCQSRCSVKSATLSLSLCDNLSETICLIMYFSGKILFSFKKHKIDLNWLLFLYWKIYAVLFLFLLLFVLFSLLFSYFCYRSFCINSVLFQTCFEKQQPPYIVPENGQVFVLMEGSFCSFPQGSNRTLNCSATRKFKSARERWWFLAVARCYQDKLLVNT